jgi:hypothetical protein
VLNVAQTPDKKIVWMYVGKEECNIVTNDIDFLVATPEGVNHFTERHKMGLFSRDDFLAAFSSAGANILHEDPQGFFGNGLYIARRE